jgi:hypothetical protein
MEMTHVPGDTGKLVGIVFNGFPGVAPGHQGPGKDRSLIEEIRPGINGGGDSPPRVLSTRYRVIGVMRGETFAAIGTFAELPVLP